MNTAIIERLLACLVELDAQGENIAAAHLDATIHELLQQNSSNKNTFKMNVTPQE
ncbi:hypothetical protein [Novosphingobium sp. B 225]|uniref:hypothetical protein n=1 Tax=Novosphingobium sp. B 225 TaxID=1961849 RepID=UPI0015962E22|nr:hypothetical protein [Novosphingobium sp. B 225]